MKVSNYIDVSLLVVLTLIAAIFAVLVALNKAHGQQRSVYDSSGHLAGTVIRNNNGTSSFYNRSGSFSGSAIDNRNGTRSFYDARGRFSGSEGPSYTLGGERR